MIKCIKLFVLTMTSMVIFCSSGFATDDSMVMTPPLSMQNACPPTDVIFERFTTGVGYHWQIPSGWGVKFMQGNPGDPEQFSTGGFSGFSGFSMQGNLVCFYNDRSNGSTLIISPVL